MLSQFLIIGNKSHSGAGTKFFFHERTRGPNFIQHFMAAATPPNASAAAPTDREGVGLYLGEARAPPLLKHIPANPCQSHLSTPCF